MKDFLKKITAVVLIITLLMVPVCAATVVTCSHDVVSASGVCANESCKAQALAKFVCGDTVEYLFTANALAWKTINMNNNGTNDTYSITLLADISSLSLTILADVVTLDLNGFDVGYTQGDFGYIVYLEEQGNLTITDSSAGGTGSMVNPTGPVVDFARAAAAPDSNAVLTVEKGTFSGKGMTFWLGAGTLYIKGGTIIGYYQAGDGSITGGAFSGDPSGDLTDEYEAVLVGEYYVVQKKLPTVTVPIKNSGDGNSVNVSAVVDGDTAAVTDVDLSGLETVIGDNANVGTVTIDFSGLETELTAVEIPAETVQKIAEAANDPQNSATSLEIVFTDGTAIEFDAAALAGKAEQMQAADVTVSIQPVDTASAETAQTAVIGDRPAYDIMVKSGDQTISDIGGKITISVPYTLGDDEDPENIVVYYVDADGNLEACRTTYNSTLGRVSWETSHLSVYMIGYADSTPSTDPYYSFLALYFATLHRSEYAITASCSAGGTITPAGVSKVRYNNSITYTIKPETGYAVADVIVDGKSVGAVSEYTFKNVQKKHSIEAVFERTNPYKDVCETDAYYDAVLYLHEEGIMIGTNTQKGIFGVDAELTRGMLVTILWRAAGCPVVKDLMQFTDVPADAYYAEAVRWAACTKLVNGVSKTEFAPEDTLTREQLCTILYRYAGEETKADAISKYKDSADVSDWAAEAMAWAHETGIYRGENKMLLPRSYAPRSLVATMIYAMMQ